jgi:ABC-type branched-subunit amino acid transport system ATPase component
MATLRADSIVMRFAGLSALDGVTLEATGGRITGLIGPNGAGKTTMFNVCGGFLRPTSGTVSIDGVDVTSESPTRRARRGIGRTFQRLELFRSLTVRENIAIAAEGRFVGDGPLSQLGVSRHGAEERRLVADATAEVIDALRLGDIADISAERLSTGQGRLVELARALASRPQILLLDEPSSGLDSAESDRFAATLRAVMSRYDLAMLLVEHDMKLVLSLCDWVYVIDFGTPIFEGTADGIRHSDEVRAAYLGKVAV